jgi:hypothetical protein
MEGLCKLKNAMTSSVIETTTFRLVAQYGPFAETETHLEGRSRMARTGKGKRVTDLWLGLRDSQAHFQVMHVDAKLSLRRHKHQPRSGWYVSLYKVEN